MQVLLLNFNLKHVADFDLIEQVRSYEFDVIIVFIRCIDFTLEGLQIFSQVYEQLDYSQIGLINYGSDLIIQLLSKQHLDRQWEREFVGQDNFERVGRYLRVLQLPSLSLAFAEIGARRLSIAHDGQVVLDYLHSQLNLTLLFVPMKSKPFFSNMGWHACSLKEITKVTQISGLTNYQLLAKYNLDVRIYNYDKSDVRLMY
ncbi:RNAse G [Weissella oryzae SG25]|uniref:RNAse G n=1 Tax=Weissella oryzae (strain DSM 25784 / JCM 18191 / LMG 30913 / SG25) TaxID=1329250 RepID=A0A069CRT1_WEIOS|nr:hypothetical protein [Weissella oryzae]GAK30087.1 RNAse G [Weissella oryzae SG25]